MAWRIYSAEEAEKLGKTLSNSLKTVSHLVKKIIAEEEY